jgi:hypothetical protein
MKTIFLTLLVFLSTSLFSQSKINVSFTKNKIFSIEDNYPQTEIVLTGSLLLESTSDNHYVFDLDLCLMYYFEDGLLKDTGKIVDIVRKDNNFDLTVVSPNHTYGGDLTTKIIISSDKDKKNTNFVLSWYYKEMNRSFSFVGVDPLIRVD